MALRPGRNDRRKNLVGRVRVVLARLDQLVEDLGILLRPSTSWVFSEFGTLGSSAMSSIWLSVLTVGRTFGFVSPVRLYLPVPVAGALASTELVTGPAGQTVVVPAATRGDRQRHPGDHNASKDLR